MDDCEKCRVLEMNFILKQLQQYKKLIKLDLPKDSKLAVIFNGDMNIDHKAETLQILIIKNNLNLISLKSFGQNTFYCNKDDYKTGEYIELAKELDYIFYQKDALEVCWDLDLPQGEDEIKELIGDKGLPN